MLIDLEGASALFILCRLNTAVFNPPSDCINPCEIRIRRRNQLQFFATRRDESFTAANADLLLSSGELIAAAVFACDLERENIPAVAMSGAQAGIITDGKHGDAEIVRVESQHVRETIEAKIVPVIAGFQGISERGEITTLGRGGSDTTAS